MPITIYAEDVRNAFQNLSRTLTDAGLVRPGHKLILTTGSKTYGNAFRINETPINPKAGTGHFRPLIGDDFLGMTRREAYESLTTRNRIISDVLYAQRTPATDTRF